MTGIRCFSKDFTVNENMNLNVRGGGKVVDYFLNASIFNENGILKKPAESEIQHQHQFAEIPFFQANVGAQLTPNDPRESEDEHATAFLAPSRRRGERPVLLYDARQSGRFPGHLSQRLRGGSRRPVVFGNAPSWDGGSTDINPYALLSRGYGQRHTQYITTTFSVDQDLDFVTKGLKVRGMVSFYNKTYAATYRSFSPYYYEMTDYTDNGDGTFDYNLQSIGTPGSSYLGTSTGRNGYREDRVAGGQIEYSRTFGKHDVNALFVYHQKEKVDNQPANDEYQGASLPRAGSRRTFTYGYDNRYLMSSTSATTARENFISGRRFGFFPRSPGVGRVGRTVLGRYPQQGEPAENPCFVRSFGQRLSGRQQQQYRPFPLSHDGQHEQGALRVVFAQLRQADRTRDQDRGAIPWPRGEESTKLNVGLELGLFDALTLNVDVYKENRTGIFMQRRSLPSTMGLSGVALRQSG